MSDFFLSLPQLKRSATAESFRYRTLFFGCFFLAGAASSSVAGVDTSAMLACKSEWNGNV